MPENGTYYCSQYTENVTLCTVLRFAAHSSALGNRGH